jgi:hypothetical protein
MAEHADEGVCGRSLAAESHCPKNRGRQQGRDTDGTFAMVVGSSLVYRVVAQNRIQVIEITERRDANLRQKPNMSLRQRVKAFWPALRD